MPAIEYFYSAHSGYAYIGSTHFINIAKARGRDIVHKPMDLRRVVAATGPGPTNSLTPQRKAYFSGREIQRWAQFRNASILGRSPSHHANEIALSNGMLIAAQKRGHNIDELAHVLLELEHVSTIEPLWAPWPPSGPMSPPKQKIMIKSYDTKVPTQTTR